MARISYNRTYFVKPGVISEELYKNLRIQLNANSNLEIDPNPETFTKHFNGSFKTIGICVGLILICGIIMGNSNEGPLVPIMGISVFIIIFTILYLILEGPSYATYIKDKKEYFDRMKYAIENTSNYREFVDAFYNR